MDIRYDVAIYQFDVKTGAFNNIINTVRHVTLSLSAKELFAQIMVDYDIDLSNKFFIMKVKYNDDNNNTIYEFYTIRMSLRGSIEDISLIGPNNYDKDMLIDAILGCKPTPNFWMNCNDRLLEKIVVRPLSKFYPDSYDENGFDWTSDAKERLNKVNSIRLKEIYKKLKANQ